MDEELNRLLENGDLDNAGKIDAIKSMLGKNFVPVSKYTEKTNEFQKMQSEYEEFKKSKMTDEERTAEELRQSKERELATIKVLSEMSAENVFATAGFKKDDYKDLIPNIIQNDVEKTKQVAQNICDSMLRQKKEIEKEIQAQIAKGQTKPTQGGEGDQKAESNVDDLKKKLNEAMTRRDSAQIAYYMRLIQETERKEN